VTAISLFTATMTAPIRPPWDWRLLINGYGDQMLYERGDLIGQVAFADLKKQALVNEKAKAANDDPDFSRRIRDGVIGF
jgi:hypothetical protein